jgi:hypothetical protein
MISLSIWAMRTKKSRKHICSRLSDYVFGRYFKVCALISCVNIALPERYWATANKTDKSQNKS